jgi:hypothetical protein
MIRRAVISSLCSPAMQPSLSERVVSENDPSSPICPYAGRPFVGTTVIVP